MSRLVPLGLLFPQDGTVVSSHMSRTFLWETEQLARKRAPEFLAARGMSSVTPDALVDLAFGGGRADQKVKRLAAQLLDEAHWQAIRRWAAWYRDVRGITSLTVDEFLACALSEPGTHQGVTKTKLRKAARRVLAKTLPKASVA